MRDTVVLLRLRRFLLATSGLLLIGTVIELLLVGHTDSLVQLLPFALCGMGLIAVLMVLLLRPRRAAMLALRACMLLVAAGSLYGVYEHVINNIAFKKEIQPSATALELLKSGLGGANPLLAPGIMALAAILAVAATYYHPALEKGAER